MARSACELERDALACGWAYFLHVLSVPIFDFNEWSGFVCVEMEIGG